MAEAESKSSLPTWLPWATTILAFAGLAVALYLTIAHYTTPKLLACPDVSVINCGKVTTSAYSNILGIPVALLGLLYFVAVVPLQLPWAWQRPADSRLHWLRFVVMASGIVMVFWLIYAELYKINAICLYCTAVHVITLALFGLTAYGTTVLD